MTYEVEKVWTTDAGLRAVVIMGELGHRCGYVGIPADHPLHGVDYAERTAALKPNLTRSVNKMSPLQVFSAMGKEHEELNTPEYVFEVHGGLTYSGGSDEYPVSSDGLWWFGYDCGHAGDAPAPSSEMGQRYASFHTDAVHRTLDYCVSECESLATQLSKVVP